jgi:hypothetical protein
MHHCAFHRRSSRATQCRLLPPDSLRLPRLMVDLEFDPFRPGHKVYYYGSEYTIDVVLIRSSGLFVILRESGELVSARHVYIA